MLLARFPVPRISLLTSEVELPVPLLEPITELALIISPIRPPVFSFSVGFPLPKLAIIFAGVCPLEDPFALDVALLPSTLVAVAVVPPLLPLSVFLPFYKLTFERMRTRHGFGAEPTELILFPVSLNNRTRRCGILSLPRCETIAEVAFKNVPVWHMQSSLP